MRLESSLICKRLRLKLLFYCQFSLGLPSIGWTVSFPCDCYAKGDKSEHGHKYGNGDKCEHADKYGYGEKYDQSLYESYNHSYERRAPVHQRNNNTTWQVMVDSKKIRQYVLQMAWLKETNAIPQSLSQVQGGAVVRALSPRSGNNNITWQVMVDTKKIRQHVLQMAWLTDTKEIPQSL